MHLFRSSIAFLREALLVAVGIVRLIDKWDKSITGTVTINTNIMHICCTEDLEMMYDSCRVEFAFRNGNSPWCVALRNEDAQVYEYSKDLFDYYRHAYAYPISYEQACNLLSDALEKML